MDARRVYREGLGQDATPVRLIVLMYEQLIHDLREAAASIESGNIESRTNQLNHALQVIGELNASLNMEQGQEVARNLAQFYELIRCGLLQVQVRPSRSILEKHISNLLALREAWVEVERRAATTSAVVPRAETPPASEPGGDRPASRGDWRV
jgi:flagellar secretion chaperone FliS